MNAPEVVAARCAVVQAERNAIVVVRYVVVAPSAECTLGAERYSSGELELVGEAKQSRRQLARNHRAPKRPTDSERGSDMRS
jgi:hypothetical protein